MVTRRLLNNEIRIKLIFVCLFVFRLENKFVIGSSDKNVAVCYYEKDQRFWAAEMIKKKPKSTVTCIVWHPNNQLIAVGSCDYRCRFGNCFNLKESLFGLF